MGGSTRSQKAKRQRRKKSAQKQNLNSQSTSATVGVEEVNETHENVETSDDDNDKEIKQVYLPGDENNTKGDVGELTYDPSAYELYHQFDLGFSCLTFSIIPKPQTNSKDSELNIDIIAGSQMESTKENKIIIASLSKMKFTKRNPFKESSSDDDDNEEEEESENELPDLKMVQFFHHGIVNRLKTTTIQNNFFLATWSDIGCVNIFNINENLQRFQNNQNSSKDPKNKTRPLFVFRNHSMEGYGLDWSSVVEGRLASGSCDGSLAIWNPLEHSWSVDLIKKFQSGGHSSSVEDIQWSPNEQNVVSTCSCDGTIKFWDLRTSNSCISTIKAHETDCNVIAWNKYDPLIASGDDNGIVKIWDLRLLSESKPISVFNHHKRAITSIEWHPTDHSTIAYSGEDDQISMWDLSAQVDDLASKLKNTTLETTSPHHNEQISREIPSQLLFIHMGQKEIKEIHWHPQYEGLMLSTALDGFNLFKTVSI